MSPTDAEVVEIVARAINAARYTRCGQTPIEIDDDRNDARYARDLAQAALAALNVAGLARIAELEAENARLSALLNTPELHDFARAVVLEAAHQRERWAAGHDAGKQPEDWFWLLGYLGGKALHAAKTGDRDKALHHTISTAAALANWHAALLGAHEAMRPGIGPGSAAFPAAEAAIGGPSNG